MNVQVHILFFHAVRHLVKITQQQAEKYFMKYFILQFYDWNM